MSAEPQEKEGCSFKDILRSDHMATKRPLSGDIRACALRCPVHLCKAAEETEARKVSVSPEGVQATGLVDPEPRGRVTD